MTDRATLTEISNQLADRYGAPGKAAADRLQIWLEGAVPMGFPDVLARHLEEQHVPLLFDAFWQVLPFGTGGRRGRVGYGSNRFNHTTAAMTVQGHCNYLATAFPGNEISVIVANDVRVFNDFASWEVTILYWGHLRDRSPSWHVRFMPAIEWWRTSRSRKPTNRS
jgi:hypothetical protein